MVYWVPEVLKKKREKEIIRRRRKRQSFSQIGKALKMSDVNVARLAKQIVEERGQEIFQPKDGKELFNFSEAARHLGISVGAFHRLYRAGKVVCKRSCQKGRLFVSKSEIERLLDCPQVSGVYKCPYCQKELPVGTGNQRKTCGKALCKKKHGAAKFARALKNKKKYVERLKGWKKAAMRAIQKRRPSENEVWIKMAEAARVSGVSVTTIYRLAALRLISMCPMNSPRHKKGSLQYNLYAKSEMELIKRFIKRYAKKQSR